MMNKLPHGGAEWTRVVVSLGMALALVGKVGKILGDGAWAAWSLANDCRLTLLIIKLERAVMDHALEKLETWL